MANIQASAKILQKIPSKQRKSPILKVKPQLNDTPKNGDDYQERSDFYV
jgi:hypothetical protein